MYDDISTLYLTGQQIWASYDVLDLCSPNQILVWTLVFHVLSNHSQLWASYDIIIWFSASINVNAFGTLITSNILLLGGIKFIGVAIIRRVWEVYLSRISRNKVRVFTSLFLYFALALNFIFYMLLQTFAYWAIRFSCNTVVKLLFASMKRYCSFHRSVRLCKNNIKKSNFVPKKMDFNKEKEKTYYLCHM